jgi:RNA-directed DNA polymerase
MASIPRFITQTLKLQVDEAKSAVARPHERKFLGFGFTDGPAVQRAIAPLVVVRFNGPNPGDHTAGQGCQHRDDNSGVAPYPRGRRNSYGFCEAPAVPQRLTRWVPSLN